MQGVTSADWSYTEYAQLSNSVKDDAQGLKDAAKHFESLFIDMWLKSAREANAAISKDSFFSSNEMEMQQQMFDSQMAMHLAKEGGIGLASTITRQLGGQPEVAAPTVAQPLVQPTNVQRPIDVAVSPISQTNDAPQKQHVTNVAVTPETENISTTLNQSGTRSTKFTDEQSFVSTLAPRIKKIVGAVGLPALAVMAQAALETGWGKSVIEDVDGESSHNLFGMKDTNWSGPSVEIHSKEFLLGGWQDKLSGFRKYPDWDTGIADYVRSITQSSRYGSAVEQNLQPAEYADFLQKAGYATDPNYAQKLKGVMQRLMGLGF